MFFVVCLDGHRTDYTICRTCNSHGDLMVIMVDVRQYRPMSDRLVAIKNGSTKFVSGLEKYIHVIVWAANVNFPVLKM